jgi:PAS domain S-box-containing protein
MDSFSDPRDWYHSILEQAPDGILVERAQKIVYVNRVYASMLGYRSPGDLLGRDTAAVVSAADAGRLLHYGQLRSQRQQAPERYAFCARRRDDAECPLNAAVSSTLVNEQVFVTTVVRPRRLGPAAYRMDSLSERERQVFDLLVAGRHQKEIAFDLGTNAKTINTYRSRLLRKLSLTDTWGLLHFAHENGLCATPSCHGEG